MGIQSKCFKTLRAIFGYIERTTERENGDVRIAWNYGVARFVIKKHKTDSQTIIIHRYTTALFTIRCVGMSMRIFSLFELQKLKKFVCGISDRHKQHLFIIFRRYFDLNFVD